MYRILEIGEEFSDMLLEMKATCKCVHIYNIIDTQYLQPTLLAHSDLIIYTPLLRSKIRKDRSYTRTDCNKQS